jgi:YcxB-like protein
MEISYRNSFGDFLRFSLYYILRSKLSLIALGFVLFAIGRLALDVARGVHFSLPGKIIAFSIVLLGGFGGFLILVLILILISAFFSYRAYCAKWSACKIQVTENSLLAESPVARTEIQWQGIEAIKQTRSLILIYVTKRMAYLVPKRAFANEIDANKFFADLSERWGKYKNR